jgi:PTH1 family peptidyl-tRNA hydrolase
MAWLQRRPNVSDPKMFYSAGLNKSVLIVGLGNPSKEYDLTRHNIGFACVDEFVEKTEELSGWIAKKDLKCVISDGLINGTKVYVIKPTTFMNLSGEAVQLTSRFFNIHPDSIAIIHDELDIDFGQIRLRLAGSDAGHNGIKSVSSLIGDGYYRIRVGIGPKKPARIKSEDFVLKKFSNTEEEQLPNLIKEAHSILSEFVYSSSLPNETRTFLI